jgi:hypothetical protein
MIIFYGQGGLGNQLFQYAAARRVALRNNTELVLDPHWFSNSSEYETHRPLELGHYPVVMRVATETEQRRWKWMRGRLGRYLGPFLPLNLLREQGTTLNRPLLNAPDNSYLFGFWQSEAYFNDIRSLLIRELTPIETPGAVDQRVLDLIDNSNAVCLHVRRGDYVTRQSASAFHGLCSLDYYHAAIRHVADRVEHPTFFVFSDDSEWTRANLHSKYPTHYVDHNNPENAFQDLFLMSRCKHHIIANSSFSWWGAWLNQRTTKIVVAPRQWFANQLSSPALIPPGWVQL